MNYAYAAAETAIKVNTNAIDAILSASWVVQLTLLVLIFLSVSCVRIILLKRKQLAKVEKEDEKFIDHFFEAKSLENLSKDIKHYKHSCAAHVFKAGYTELMKIADSNGRKSQPSNLKGIENIERALLRATRNEISCLDKNLNLLATTGSTGPFIGLFGTVWGIMGSFQKIGQTGAASLAIVAPGISEALVATAVGLLAAIPAVIAYNNFNSRIGQIEGDLNNFSADFLNIVKRHFFQD